MQRRRRDVIIALKKDISSIRQTSADYKFSAFRQDTYPNVFKHKLIILQFLHLPSHLSHDCMRNFIIIVKIIFCNLVTARIVFVLVTSTLRAKVGLNRLTHIKCYLAILVAKEQTSYRQHDCL